MINKQRLLTPGPTPLPERVRLAMARDMIHHRKANFKTIIERIKNRLSALFGARETVIPLAASGTGAMQAAVLNLFAPGEKVLVIDGGKFGERWTEISERFNLDPVVMKVEWGKAVSPEAVETALDADKSICGVLVQLSETSTGVMHPIEAISRITRTRQVMLVVDGISGVSICPCPMDDWGIDCLLTGSQKGLMLPPGLALIALSARAWERVSRNKPRDFYFNLAKERECLEKCQTSFTPAIGLLVGLDESLQIFEETGLDNIYRKQYALTMQARKSAEALGLPLFVKENYAYGVTAITLPCGISASALLKRMAERHGVIMAAGQGDVKDSMIRIGHMGWIDYGDLLAGLWALAESFTAVGGFIGARNYLEIGLCAYNQALETWPQK